MHVLFCTSHDSCGQQLIFTALCPLYRTAGGVVGLTCLDTKRTVWSYCTSTGKPVIGIDVWKGHHVVRYVWHVLSRSYALPHGRPVGTQRPLSGGPCLERRQEASPDQAVKTAAHRD